MKQILYFFDKVENDKKNADNILQYLLIFRDYIKSIDGIQIN